LLAPMGTSLSTLAVPIVLLLVVLFGLGILLSMSLFGVVLARLISLRRLEAVGRWAGVIVAAARVLNWLGPASGHFRSCGRLRVLFRRRVAPVQLLNSVRRSA